MLTRHHWLSSERSQSMIESNLRQFVVDSFDQRILYDRYGEPRPWSYFLCWSLDDRELKKKIKKSIELNLTIITLLPIHVASYPHKHDCVGGKCKLYFNNSSRKHNLDCISTNTSGWRLTNTWPSPPTRLGRSYFINHRLAQQCRQIMNSEWLDVW